MFIFSWNFFSNFQICSEIHQHFFFLHFAPHYILYVFSKIFFQIRYIFTIFYKVLQDFLVIFKKFIKIFKKVYIGNFFFNFSLKSQIWPKLSKFFRNYRRFFNRVQNKFCDLVIVFWRYVQNFVYGCAELPLVRSSKFPLKSVRVYDALRE